MNVRGTLNFKHLRYFAEIARRGSVVAAARAMYVAPQTVSSQLRMLEEEVGQALFERVGRRLKLTSAGETALDYANAIFALGDEFGAVMRGTGKARNQMLRVGITESVPKLLSVRLLQVLTERHGATLELHCHEGSFVELLGQLAAGGLDVVLADAAVPSNLARVLQARALADSGISFVAVRRRAATLARRFPASLDGEAYVSGSAPSSLQTQAIEAWFARQGVNPRIAGRIDDSALLLGFAQGGLGVIAVPTSIESEVLSNHGLGVVGRTGEVRQQVFLVRARGRRPHPLVADLESGQGM
ncbi:MAG: transcriptional activator NhaR [Pseudomonadota bacterium]